MAHKTYSKSYPDCGKVDYDWVEKYDPQQMTRQECYKLCVIELNEMYRNGQESPVSDQTYDYIMGLIDDEEFHRTVGTGLGKDFVPAYLLNKKGG